MKGRSTLGVILSKLIGILVLLVVWGAANIVYVIYPNTLFEQVLGFINRNMALILFFSVILFLGELFSVFSFPFNLPYPLFNALGSIFVVTFIFRIFSLIRTFEPNVIFPFTYFRTPITCLVFFIVLIVGYVKVFKSVIQVKHKKKKHRK